MAAKRVLHVANLIPQRANLCKSHTCSGTLKHTSALSVCEHMFIRASFHQGLDRDVWVAEEPYGTALYLMRGEIQFLFLT